MKTDLYYNNSECKDVRFLRDRTTSLENFWRSPCGHVSIFPSRGVHSTNNRRKLEIGQTGVAVVTDENSGLAKGYRRGLNRSDENIYPI